uniref:Reverse transcriptase-rnase h-integrase n=1 Tax=Moniliophthora roreri TaxID=221103 RepID=A0A0W0G223_MONRR
MSGEGSLSPKREWTQEEMMITVTTAVLEAVEKNKEKEKSAKVAPPDFFEEDRKNMRRFLTEAEIFLCMNPKDYDTDEKKCLFLLSYMRGKGVTSWKLAHSDKIFNQKSKDPPCSRN